MVQGCLQSLLSVFDTEAFSFLISARAISLSVTIGRFLPCALIHGTALVQLDYGHSQSSAVGIGQADFNLTAKITEGSILTVSWI